MKINGLILGILCCVTAHADIYKWTDSQGNVYFSDKPQPGSEKVILHETQTFSSPTPPKAPTQTETQKTETQIYKTFKILSPEPEATIWDNQGNLSILVQIEPALKKNHDLQLLFDGKPLGSPQTAPAFSLTNIERGSHTIVVTVIDKTRTVIQTTPSITFYMHKASVGFPNRRGSP